MLTTQQILGILLSLPAWHQDTDEQNRRARLEIVASSIQRAATELQCVKGKTKPSAKKLTKLPIKCWSRSYNDLVLLLVTQGFWESRYALFVHEGRCNRRGSKHCDGGRAASIWQIQRTAQVPRKSWRRLIGTSQKATNHAAFTAARLLSRADRACGSVEGAIAQYATGNSCHWKGAQKRLYFWWQLRQKHGKK